MLWVKQNASSARQEIFVHLPHKESSLVKVGHTVRMGRLSARNAQEDTGELWSIPLAFEKIMQLEKVFFNGFHCNVTDHMFKTFNC